ncbi:hypothetical protein AB6A40_002504 [Gnathostoma spinigerum]|uniref:Hydroxymethylglutaryl-CoA synthase n=1 Tax=Gnathostoma spinigerum TaxID=75299 RepID=A0ABD6EHJ5_9BILA
MGFCADHEDVASLCLTVLSTLLENTKIDISSVGFLCVGTETLIDKSKSVKTQLMELFGDQTDIEGVDVKNACYGGTQALFHAVDWIYANWSNERRYAIVVMGDIAVYEAGPARCTGGAGAFAALIGPNALFSIDKGLRACHIANFWDFYKPVVGNSSEYAVVAGSESLRAYLSSVDSTYERYLKKAVKLTKQDLNVDSFVALLYHAPFCTLLKKALGRMVFSDFKNGRRKNTDSHSVLVPFLAMPYMDTLSNRDFSAAVVKFSQQTWLSKVEPNLFFNKRVGNMYTASLYAQLVAFLGRSESLCSVQGHKMLLFSYGSGLASAMFSITINPSRSPDIINQYEVMKKSSKAASERLESRVKVSPERYTETLKMREELISCKVPYTPMALRMSNRAEFDLFPRTFYLKSIDNKWRRLYGQSDEKGLIDISAPSC